LYEKRFKLMAQWDAYCAGTLAAGAANDNREQDERYINEHEENESQATA
jgi:hypothetical protein